MTGQLSLLSSDAVVIGGGPLQGIVALHGRGGGGRPVGSVDGLIKDLICSSVDRSACRGFES